MNVTETLSKNTTIPVGVGKTDNTDEMVNVARVMHWYSSVVVGSVFVVIGLIGNTLSIIVWNRKPLRCSTGTYLVCQALSHIIALLFFFFTDTVVMLEPEVKKHYFYGVFYSYIGYPMAYLSVIISIWMTVGVTVDRYILVCWIRYSKVCLLANVCLMVLNATFNNISIISWRSVLLMEETGGPGENHQPVSGY